MAIGDIQNRDWVTDRRVVGVADNVSLTAGMIVYQDAGNGLKVVPTTGIPGDRCYFLEKAADNTISGHTALGIKAEIYKKGAIVHAKCDGAITVNTTVRASTTTAGRVETVADPTAPSATYVQAQAASLRTFVLFRIGRYIGNALEGKQLGSIPTDAADLDEVVVVMD